MHAEDIQRLLTHSLQWIASDGGKDKVKNPFRLFEECKGGSDDIRGNESRAVDSRRDAHSNLERKYMFASEVRLDFFRVVFGLLVGFFVFLFVDDACMTG